ncbi:hypothetical protein DL93DRAFT_2141052 [Clavulina sp. PMI_390]|nr:hypothetical protein DL93DRAFT_2141052 [Clavulina sp. PMI_390]
MADPPIIDGSVLERQKENIVPSRDGRSALAISQVYSMPRAQRDKELAATHTRFREQIEATKDNEDFEDDEALDLYCQYVGWIMDNYPSGSSTESGLLGVLEDATRRFAQEPIYKNDRRYIRLWMEYANLIEQSDRVYAFMLANEIGWAWPHVYEEYALILERNGNLSKADQIYRLAINRRVSGLASLKAHYKEFQARCASRPSGVDEDPVPPPVQATSRPPLGGRSVLGTINPQRSRQPAPQSLVPRTPAAPPSRSNAGKIAVFVDGGDSQEDAQLNEWSTLQTRGEAIKENTASKVDGALHQRPFVPRTPKVMIHRDEVGCGTSHP